MNVLKLKKIQGKDKQYLIAILQEGKDIQEHPEKLFSLSSREVALIAIVLKAARINNLKVGVNYYDLEHKLSRARGHAKSYSKRTKRIVGKRKPNVKAVS